MQRKLLILFSLIFIAQAQASWVSSYFQWTDLALGSAFLQNGNYVRQIPDSRSLVELRQNYGSVALKQIYARMSNIEVIRNNENLVELVKQDISFDHNPNGFSQMGDSLRSLDKRQARAIYDAMIGAYVVKNQRKYGGRGVGFCFGRALVAHNEALIRNVHPASIRKIWVIGDMGFWGHHVSTIVKSKDSWVAIDNFTGIMTVEKWIERMKFERKGGKELGFFITRAGRFGHATNSLYNTIDLFNIPERSMTRYASTEAKNRLKSNDFYQGFFMDFYEALEENASTVRQFSESEARVQRQEEARIARLSAAEIQEYEKSLTVEDVTGYDLTQETIYCHNTENQKLNCNYQLGEEDVFETSVSIAGNAQYQIQNLTVGKVYAKHILSAAIEEESYHIVEDAKGRLAKVVVELIIPQYSNLRPYLKVINVVESTQVELTKEVMQIKDVLAKFNNKYKVKAENASPITRILNN